MSQGTSKITAERNQRTLLELASIPGNDVCADCKAWHPRWASYNLGIFICMSCAGIHRKMGTHISKVKSVTLDQWSKEQVEVMKQMGNLKSNAIYNPDEVRHPPPVNTIDSERDSDLEKYIRAKYQYRQFVARSHPGPSQSGSSSQPPSQPPPASKPVSIPPPAPASTSQNVTSSTPSSVAALRTQSQIRSVSLPVAAQPSPQQQYQPPPQQHPQSVVQQQPQHHPQQQQQQQQPTGVWADLASLNAPSTNSSLPLQYAQPGMGLSAQSTGYPVQTGYAGLSANPAASLPAQQTGFYQAQRSMSLNTGLGAAPVSTGLGIGSGLLGGGLSSLSTPQMYGSPQPSLGTVPTGSPYGTQPTSSPMQYSSQWQGMPVQQQQQPQPQVTQYGQSGYGVPMGYGTQMQQQQPSQPQQQQQFYQQQGSPMYQPQPVASGYPTQQQQQPQQPQQQMYGSPQAPYVGTPSPVPFGQQQPQQPQMYGQPQQGQGSYGGAGWQQTGYPGQQWGGM